MFSGVCRAGAGVPPIGRDKLHGHRRSRARPRIGAAPVSRCNTRARPGRSECNLVAAWYAPKTWRGATPNRAADGTHFGFRKKRWRVQSDLARPSIRPPAGRTICSLPTRIRLRGSRPSNLGRMVSLAGQRIDCVLLLPLSLRVKLPGACAPVSGEQSAMRPLIDLPRAHAWCECRLVRHSPPITNSVCKEG